MFQLSVNKELQPEHCVVCIQREAKCWGQRKYYVRVFYSLNLLSTLETGQPMLVYIIYNHIINSVGVCSAWYSWHCPQPIALLHTCNIYVGHKLQPIFPFPYIM